MISSIPNDLPEPGGPNTVIDKGFSADEEKNSINVFRIL
jgi:hypothetical protein